MKKTIAVLFFITLFCIPSWGSMQGISPSDAKTLAGGRRKDSAVVIPVSQYGQVWTDTVETRSDSWYELQAPADGTYVICFDELPDPKYGKESFLTYRLYDGNSQKDCYNGGELYVSTYSVKKGDIIRLDSDAYGTGNSFIFSVCFDGYHKPGEASEVYRYPTCSETGIKVYPCLICGREGKTEELSKLPHTIGEWKKEKNPGCTTTGLNVQRCTVCNEIINQQEIPAIGHGSTNSVVTQPATCLTAGIKAEQCVVCLETLSTEVLPLTDHTPGVMKTVSAPSCTTNGRGEQRCTVCNTLLNEEIINAYGHNYSEWQTIVEPTKQSEGQRMRYCHNCGTIEYEPIEKLPKFLGVF